MIEQCLDQLPPKLQSDIVYLLLLAPSDLVTSSDLGQKPEKLGEYMFNLEFKDPNLSTF